MDLQKFKEWAEVVGTTLGVLKTAKDMLPDSPQRTETEKLIEQSATAFKSVEAELAKSLGFPLCLRCWPPEIMLVSDDNVPRCRHCKQPMPPEAEIPFVCEPTH